MKNSSLTMEEMLARPEMEEEDAERTETQEEMESAIEPPKSLTMEEMLARPEMEEEDAERTETQEEMESPIEPPKSLKMEEMLAPPEGKEEDAENAETQEGDAQKGDAQEEDAAASEKRAAAMEAELERRRRNAAATVTHTDAGAFVKGLAIGAAEGAAKGAARAAKEFAAPFIGLASGAVRLAGTPLRMLGYDGVTKAADWVDGAWQNWGADALDLGYSDALTETGDFGGKVAGIAGMTLSFMAPGAAAKAAKVVSGARAAKAVTKAAEWTLPAIFGNDAAARTYDTAIANGQGRARALAEAGAAGAINFIGFRVFATKAVDRWFRIPEMQKEAFPKILQGFSEGKVRTFSELARAVRNGSVRLAAARRLAGAVKAGGIMAAQDFLSSFPEQLAEMDVRSDAELMPEERAARAEREEAWRRGEGEKPAEMRDAWDMAAEALNRGLHGLGEGALMEGVLGAGEVALTLRDARKMAAESVRAMVRTEGGRDFVGRQNPERVQEVARKALEGGRVTAEELDAAGLPPDMRQRDVRRLAFDLRRDAERAGERAAKLAAEGVRLKVDAETGAVSADGVEGVTAERTETQKGEDGGTETAVTVRGISAAGADTAEKRGALAEMLEQIVAAADGKPLTFDSQEAKEIAEIALRERAESLRREAADGRADALADAAQALADRVFGEGAGILVRRGTRQEAERAARAALGRDADVAAVRDTAGEVRGMWNRKTGELALFEGATVETVAHELAGHAVRQWAERNAPGLKAKFDAYARECPEELRREIGRLYADFTGEELLDELAANRLERELGGRFREILEGRPAAKTWWERVKAEFREVWRQVARSFGGGGIDVREIEGMEPAAAMERLVDGMLEGRPLKGARRGGKERGSGGVRPSIGGIFTGSGADYDKPSLHFVGSGEGSQVYGWGLYGSNVRGIAERYAEAAKGEAESEVRYRGKPVEEDAPREIINIASAFRRSENGDVEGYLKKMEAVYERLARETPKLKDAYGEIIELNRKALETYRADPKAWSMDVPKEHVYEQTFFTDRAPGDESRLLKWHEPVDEGQRELIREGLKSLGGERRRAAIDFVNGERGKDLAHDGLTWKDVEGEDAPPEYYADDVLFDHLDRYIDLNSTGGDVYEQLTRVFRWPSAASEFLAEAGIDGVKYPADSYGGKGVKDGDVAGWNYVSFRDDNVRVDHKWTDGKMRYSISPSEDAAWRKTVEDFTAGKTARRTDATVLPRTPAVISRVLKDRFGIDAEGRSIVISTECLAKAMHGKHRIAAGEMMRLARSLDAPMAVFQSMTRPNDTVTALVAIRDMNGGISSIVPVDYTARITDGKAALRITSVYGKTSAEAVQSWIDKGYLLYVDRKNISRSFPHRLQLPGRNKTAKRFLDETDFSQERLGIVAEAAQESKGGAERDERFSIAGLWGAERMGIGGLSDAVDMEKDGAGREEIWRSTGWWRGKDGGWRVEIVGARMKDANALLDALTRGRNDTTLGQIMDAPALFKAYPHLKYTRIVLSPEDTGLAGGWYDRKRNEIFICEAGIVSGKDRPSKEREVRKRYEKILASDEYLRSRLSAMDEMGIDHGTEAEEREYARGWIERNDRSIAEENEAKVRHMAADRHARSVFGKIVHEVQHAVQQMEGFAGGGDVNEEDYHRFAGEVEARNAARREAMSPEERAAIPPWETEEVPQEEQVVRFSIASAEDAESRAVRDRWHKADGEMRYSVRVAPEYRERLTFGLVDERTAKSTVAAWRKTRTEFVNRHNLRVAELKSDWSKVFASKTKGQSDSYEAHYAAANNIKTLFENGVKYQEEKPRNGSADIAAYAKYACPFALGEDTYLAKITVKEYPAAGAKDGVYSVESIAAEKIGVGGNNAAITNIRGQSLDPDAINALGKMLQTQRIIPQPGAERSERFSIARTKEGKTFALLDRPVDIDWNDRDSVRDYLATLIGTGAVSLADGKRIRIGADLPKEYTRSNYAQKAFRTKRLRKLRGKTAKHLDELIVVSDAPETEASIHRSDRTYYRRPIGFGVAGHEKSIGYGAELVTYEQGGEEYLYDIVGIREDRSLSSALGAGRHGGYEILSTHTGERSTAEIVPQGGRGAQGGGLRPSIRRQSEAADAALRAVTDGRVDEADAMEAHVESLGKATWLHRQGEVEVPNRGGSDYGGKTPLKAKRKGGVRVADEGERQYAEADDAYGRPGAEAARERHAARVAPRDDVTVARPVAFSMSQMVALYRALRRSAALPRVLQEAKRRGERWVSRLTKGSEVELNPEAFGIVDRSDVERIRRELEDDGMFRHENPKWALTHTREQREEERVRSEFVLGEEVAQLAARRVQGYEKGGGTATANAMAHEIGCLVEAMKMADHGGGNGGDILTALKKACGAMSKRIREDLNGGARRETAFDADEAARAVAWWSGVARTAGEEVDAAQRGGEAALDEMRRAEEAETQRLKLDRDGLARELVGMFFGAPEALKERCRWAYDEIVNALSESPEAARAYENVAREGAPSEVMERLERQWRHETEVQLRELEREIDRPLGTVWQRAKRRVLLNLHSREEPAVSIVADGFAEKVAAAKRALAAARRGGRAEDVARAKGNLDLIRAAAKRTLGELRIGVLRRQRGGGEDRVYLLNMANRMFEDMRRRGVSIGDLRTYMKCQRCIEIQGRADSFGMTPAQAHDTLEGLRRRLGDKGCADLAWVQDVFRRERESAILENPDVIAAFGKGLVEAWKRNRHYVRTERVVDAAAAKEYAERRREFLKDNPGGADVMADIEAMLDMHRLRRGGSGGSVFAEPLKGSLKASADPIAYTLANDLKILAFARRNVLIAQLADVTGRHGTAGFVELSDAAGLRSLEGSRRYGSIAFMRNGERRLLVMPKVAAEGLKGMAERDIEGLVKVNRAVSAILTQYSPRFAWRNVLRNRAGAEINVPWLRESRLVTAARLAGMGPLARLAEHLMERAVVHMPDRAMRSAAANIMWGPNTTMYWIAEATRIAKMLTEPGRIRERAEEATAAWERGDHAEAQRIVEELDKVQAMARKPIFAGQWRMMMGRTDMADVDAVFAAMNMQTDYGGVRFGGLRKAARAARRLADTVRRFNDFEEMRIKIVAELAAERQRNADAAAGREFRYGAGEVDYLTATMAGSPRYEMRGRWMNVLEAIPFGPFANVGMKGAWRTVESMRTDPAAWWRKAAARIAGRAAEIALWGAGGYALVAAVARRMAGDDEDLQRAIDGFESFGRRMARARACISDYRLRNYDIVPLGLYGGYASFGVNLPRGDEDRMVMPLVDTVARGLLTSETARRMGFSDPIDGAYTPVEAVTAAVSGSGLLPDMMRGSMIWNLGKDTLYAWLQNPYNTFTQRTTYDRTLWDERFERPGEFLTETLKQAWNDVGGQVLLPLSTWDEDEGDVPDEGRWVMGMADMDDAAEMPVGGRTIFRALHYVPLASTMLSGMFYLNCDGDARIARRLKAMQERDRALRNRVAMRCVALMMRQGDVCADYSAIIDGAAKEYGWDGEDVALVEQAIVRKMRRFAKESGRERRPILRLLDGKMTDRERERMLKRLEAIGWEQED